tara:strand:- start:76 stop:1830 length:1755 start_codon:yes stop_codon:yes gene_type:complete
MLLTKILNLSRKFLALLTFTIFLNSNLFGVESIDIWNNGKKKDNTQEKKLEDKKKDTQINYSPEDKNLGQIQIEENLNNFDESKELIGLYDPEKNDLNLTMWQNTDGKIIEDIFNRINKIDLSPFSEKIFINTIFTYTYPPKNNLDNDKFLKLKLNWLTEKKKIELIEEFLNKNLEFSGKSNLIKFLVDHYISLGDISKSCEKANLISKEIKDNYLDKFRIYCLILNKKNEQAQLNFDLLREEKRSDSFFDNKISFLLGVKEKSDNKISDKNLLYFYLSSITVENFNYEPKQKTDKNIWKYLTASNLIAIDKIEDPDLIKKYEIAANQETFDKSKIFEIYLSVPFNITQLINAENTYQSLSGYEARSLIYQKILLSDQVENKLKLLFLLKDLFDKDDLKNIFPEYLNQTLQNIDPNDVPEDYRNIVKRNIIIEKTKKLGRIKFDDKVLHRSKVTKIFIDDKPNTEKIEKDFLSLHKKMSRNKKYFFSIKDVILIDTLATEGVKMPKDLNLIDLTKNLTIPPNIKLLVDNGEIGMLMLKLVEIIGSDDIENLDPETLYFIVNILNKAKMKKIRNEILTLTLPLRV